MYEGIQDHLVTSNVSKIDTRAYRVAETEAAVRMAKYTRQGTEYIFASVLVATVYSFLSLVVALGISEALSTSCDGSGDRVIKARDAF